VSNVSELSSLRIKFGVGNNPCLRHAQMISKGHWSFCPYCGERLQFIAKCQDCGRKFTSEASFLVHKSAVHSGLQEATTRHRRETGNAVHRIVFLKRRNCFFCSDCRKELTKP
jgi:DNA-directed RNA polymerase subunit RPC12/RpoP